MIKLIKLKVFKKGMVVNQKKVDNNFFGPSLNCAFKLMKKKIWPKMFNNLLKKKIV